MYIYTYIFSSRKKYIPSYVIFVGLVVFGPYFLGKKVFFTRNIIGLIMMNLLRLISYFVLFLLS